MIHQAKKVCVCVSMCVCNGWAKEKKSKHHVDVAVGWRGKKRSVENSAHILCLSERERECVRRSKTMGLPVEECVYL